MLCRVSQAKRERPSACLERASLLPTNFARKRLPSPSPTTPFLAPNTTHPSTPSLLFHSTHQLCDTCQPPSFLLPLPSPTPPTWPTWTPTTTSRAPMTVCNTLTRPTPIAASALTMISSNPTLRLPILGSAHVRVTSTSILTAARAAMRRPCARSFTNFLPEYPRGGDRSRSRSPGADRDGDTRIRDDSYSGRGER